jgi:hypothetical protein
MSPHDGQNVLGVSLKPQLVQKFAVCPSIAQHGVDAKIIYRLPDVRMPLMNNNSHSFPPLCSKTLNAHIIKKGDGKSNLALRLRKFGRSA